ncbi:MAG: electron transport complex subunit RsxB [Arsenophonus sp.]|nr:MAG: electron transport complex subunit RsxB [Arsenophonus sp.]
MNPIFTSILFLGLLGFFLGSILSLISFYCKSNVNPIIEKINDVLPQSQCGQCSYPGCHPYAESIVNNNEKINKCIPGGKDVIIDIETILNVESNSSYKIEKKTKKVAFIKEDDCIGCNQCAKVCPIDSIVGSFRYMHTVLSEICTGCKICVPICPVNCIEIIPKKSYSSKKI